MYSMKEDNWLSSSVYNLIINVGIGEYRTAHSPHILKTVLGSCVGVLIYEKEQKIGGMAHIYLPYSHEFNLTHPLNCGDSRLAFADILIPRMLAKLYAMQGKRSEFQAYITGGGYLLKENDNPSLNIGERNLNAARDILRREEITARELNIGNSHGLSVIFTLLDGGIQIKQYH